MNPSVLKGSLVHLLLLHLQLLKIQEILFFLNKITKAWINKTKDLFLELNATLLYKIIEKCLSSNTLPNKLIIFNHFFRKKLLLLNCLKCNQSQHLLAK